MRWTVWIAALALSLWPRDLLAQPEHRSRANLETATRDARRSLFALAQIASAYERLLDYPRAMPARIEAADTLVELDRAGLLLTSTDAARVRDALHDAAILAHRRAATARARMQEEGCFTRARACSNVEQRTIEMRADYAAALSGYAAFERDFPEDPDRDALTYNRADALLAIGRSEEAMAAYAAVRDAWDDDALVAPAALMVVRIAEQAIRDAVAHGSMDPCTALRAGIAADERNRGALARCTLPPIDPRDERRVVPQPIPSLVAQLIAARRAYVLRVPAMLDTAAQLSIVLGGGPQPPFAPAFALANARTLVRFGDIVAGEGALRAVLRRSCANPTVALAAYAELQRMFAALHRDDDRDALAASQQVHACANVDPSMDLADGRFRRAAVLFDRAGLASGDDARHGYESASEALRAAAESLPSHPDTLRALVMAGLADERAGRNGRAAETYARILERYAHANAPAQLDDLERAAFGRARALEHTLSFDLAEQAYRAALDDPRFRTREGYGAMAHDAWLDVADLAERQHAYGRAREAWRAFAGVADGDDERIEATLRAAESYAREGDPRNAVSALEAFRRDTPVAASTAAAHVRALDDLADAYRALHQTDAEARSLAALRSLGNRFRFPPGSGSARALARALDVELSDAIRAFASMTFRPGDGRSLGAQMDARERALGPIDDLASSSFHSLGGEASVTALVQAASAHETLAVEESRATAIVTLGARQQSALSRLPGQTARLRALANTVRHRNTDLANRLDAQADALDEQGRTLRASFTASVQDAVDARARRQRLEAVRLYALAVHLARVARLTAPEIAAARARLRDDENRPLLTEALRSMPEAWRNETGIRPDDPTLAYDVATGSPETGEMPTPELAR